MSISLIDYLQVNAFYDLMVVKRERVYLEFYEQKPSEELRVSVENGWLEAARPYFWNINIKFNLGSHRVASSVAKLKEKV